MKQICLILSLSFLVSCGRDAEVIKAPNTFLPNPGIKRALAKDDKIDPIMRTSSIIVYPNPNELTGFTFTPDESWPLVLNEVNYADRMPTGLLPSMSNETKAMTIVRTVLMVSEVRDQSFKNKGIINRNFRLVTDQYDKLVAQITAKYPCYYIEVDESEVVHCKKVARSDDASAEATVAESCSDLKAWVFDHSEDEAKNFEKDMNTCGDAQTEYREKRDFAKAETRRLDDVRKRAKGIVTQMLKKAEEEKKERFILTASTEEDNEDEEFKSSLVISNDKTKIESFELYIDAGAGFKQYNLVNGGITNLRYYERGFGVKALEFTINGEEGFTVEASLAEDVQDLFGLRFVGEITYKEGRKVRKGVMKLEWDLAKE